MSNWFVQVTLLETRQRYCFDFDASTPETSFLTNIILLHNMCWNSTLLLCYHTLTVTWKKFTVRILFGNQDFIIFNFTAQIL